MWQLLTVMTLAVWLPLIGWLHFANRQQERTHPTGTSGKHRAS